MASKLHGFGLDELERRLSALRRNARLLNALEVKLAWYMKPRHLASKLLFFSVRCSFAARYVGLQIPSRVVKDQDPWALHLPIVACYTPKLRLSRVTKGDEFQILQPCLEIRYAHHVSPSRVAKDEFSGFLNFLFSFVLDCNGHSLLSASSSLL
jgi:hypothetical protein